ncbi:RNA 2'-phosphotransferase [Mucilaginibacter mali]|uniref:Probable RNA 2'-phosphotransferase n=1 Tax=Mucilaginibacter mali TaxID=2740462 RepID=A0A7D4UJN9_9SPHI|nr:RNA 2'-phosphotransferase [Mucilaginibacter mali]QKJ29422.1 RNA 2'-phosphotransferase [Mucilaginibacter mali]
MISDKENKNISKFLSLVLRHQPELIGIELDENGWTDVDALIAKSGEHGVRYNIDALKHVVTTNNKQRFAFNDTFDRIRANQGHSVEVDLGYEAKIPPEVLYHGSAIKNADSILASGLEKRERHHVHLSADVATAANVGQRHGKPVIFEVTALQMHHDGMPFFLSNNGVWLTDAVPPKYLKKQ